jgi:hypothetical protein
VYEHNHAFISLPDGRLAWIPHRALAGMNFSDLQPGMCVECEVEETDSGLRVLRARALLVEATSASPAASIGNRKQ